MIPAFRKKGELVAPRVPKLGEAVQQHHKRPLSGLGRVQTDPVDVEQIVSKVVHGLSYLREVGDLRCVYCSDPHARVDEPAATLWPPKEGLS